MTLDQIRQRLVATGLPVAYGDFPEEETPECPRLVYIETNSQNFYADGEVYFHKGDVDVYLFTEIKDPETESLVEENLRGVTWEKDEEKINSQRVYIVTYSFQITN